RSCALLRGNQPSAADSAARRRAAAAPCAGRARRSRETVVATGWARISVYGTDLAHLARRGRRLLLALGRWAPPADDGGGQQGAEQQHRDRDREGGPHG